MPKELFRISGDIQWLRTIIRRRSYGIEMELHLATREGQVSVAIDNIPNREFLIESLDIDCLAIWEYSVAERGWTENDRFELRINDEEDCGFATVIGTYARWGPIATEPESCPSGGVTDTSNPKKE